MAIVKVKKPKTVMFDISGTVARESFVEKILLPYFKIAYRVYLESNWSKPECQNVVKQLAEASQKGDAPKINIESGDKKQIIDEICAYVEYCMNTGKESKAFAIFRFNVWFDGYDRGKLTTPVYSDVAITVQRWKCNQQIKLYVLSNGWVEASKKFLSKTSHGDLNLVIDGHFDTALGPLTETETFVKVAEAVGDQPEDIVFLTKNTGEANAAKEAKFNVVLVLTHGVAVDAALQVTKDIPIARTFTDIEFI